MAGNLAYYGRWRAAIATILGATFHRDHAMTHLLTNRVSVVSVENVEPVLSAPGITLLLATLGGSLLLMARMLALAAAEVQRGIQAAAQPWVL
jgi:hypothetical protein